MRAGYAYDNSSADNEHRNFNIPDVDRQWYAIGASYKLDKHQNFDLGYALLQSRAVDISQKGIGDALEVKGKMKKSTVNIVSAQYNYVF